MYQDLPIQDIYAREILDSRGNPTVEVEILAGERIVARPAPFSALIKYTDFHKPPRFLTVYPICNLT